MAITTTYLQQGLAEKVKTDATRISLLSDANGEFGVTNVSMTRSGSVVSLPNPVTINVPAGHTIEQISLGGTTTPNTPMFTDAITPVTFPFAGTITITSYVITGS